MRTRACALLTTIGLAAALANACIPRDRPPSEGNWFSLETIETITDPVYGSLSNHLNVSLQGQHLNDLAGATGDRTYFSGLWSGYDGILYVGGNPRVPAYWRFWELTGPCAGQAAAPWTIPVQNYETVVLNCIVGGTRIIGLTDFDETGNPISVTCCNTNTLTGEMALYLNDRITSADGRFHLAYQGDGNLVLYQGATPIWASGTDYGNYGRAVMQSDGNFVIYDQWGSAIWHTNTGGNPGAYLIVQNDGNVVIYSSQGWPLWATNTCCR